MASILKASPQLVHVHLQKPATPYIIHYSLPLLFPSRRYSSNSSPQSSSGYGSVRVGGHDGADTPNLLKKPVVSPPYDANGDDAEAAAEEVNGGEEERNNEEKEGESHWVALEDQILEDTVPLINIVRLILHSTKYRSGERLSPQHEKLILERLLPYHPDYEGKIGCGIDYITVGYHPEFENSRCLFIVRKDGEAVDFSYWKCIKGLVRKNYPLLTDGYIFKQIRQQRRNE